MSKTIDVFTKAKNKLIAEYHEAATIVDELADVLRKHGIKIPKKGKRTPLSIKIHKTKKLAKRKLGKAQVKAIAALSAGGLTEKDLRAKLKSKFPVYGILSGLIEKRLVKKTGNKYAKIVS